MPSFEERIKNENMAWNVECCLLYLSIGKTSLEYFEEAYVMTCLTILKIIKANTINPHRNPMNCVIPLCPVVWFSCVTSSLYRWGNWGLGRASDFPRVGSLVKVMPTPCLAPESTLGPHCFQPRKERPQYGEMRKMWAEGTEWGASGETQKGRRAGGGGGGWDRSRLPKLNSWWR